MGKLNPKQQRFVQEYLKDLNGTQAAIRAGYSAKTAQEQSSRLLSHVIVNQAIKQGIDKRAKRVEITQDEIIAELRKVAFGGMDKLARWNASGVQFHDSAQLDADTLANVAEVSETTNQHGGSLKIKRYDKVKALELLGRHVGMFNDKLEIVEGERPLKDLTDAELAKLRGDE